MAKGSFIKKALDAIKRRTQRLNKKKSGCGLKRKPTPYPRRQQAGDAPMSLPKEHQPAVESTPKPKGDGPRAYGLTRTPRPVPTRGTRKVRRCLVAPGIKEAAEESEDAEVLDAHLEKLNISSRVQDALVVIAAQGLEVESPPAKEERPEGFRHVSILDPPPRKPKWEGKSSFGGLKPKPTPITSMQRLRLLDKHRYASRIDAVKVDLPPSALRKHVDGQLQSTNNDERLRLPGPGQSPLCQAYVLPEPKVDYKPDIPSNVGFVRPLSAGDLRGQDIGSGLCRVPTPIPGVGGYINKGVFLIFL